jgi:hypothetical protein
LLVTNKGGITMKGNFWHKIFRKGYNVDYPHGDAAKYNGNMAKTDAKTTRSKLKRFLDKVYKVEEQQ